MVIAIGLDHATDAAKAQRAVSDMTNELLKKNAEALKVANRGDSEGIRERYCGYRDPSRPRTRH